MAKKLPLWLVTLTSVNIIVGGAFFLGAPKLVEVAGAKAPFIWLFVALLFSPLVCLLTVFAEKFPFAGGLYVYAHRTLGPYAGFLSGSFYFAATATGTAVLVHAFSTKLFQLNLLPQVFSSETMTLLGFDFLCTILFFIFSLRGVEMLRWFQIIVTSFKSIPILFVLLATLFFSRSNSSSFALVGQGSGAWLVDGLPIVIFAFLGIECICALAHMIEQGEKNASRAIFLSFFVVTVLYAVLQYGLIAVLGKAASSPDAFARVPLLFFSSPVLIKISQLFVSLGIVVSYLGGAYGSFYANNWILYAMAHDIVAQEGKQRSPLVRLNEFGEPAVPIFLQAVIMIGMLLFFNHWALVSISDLGVVFSYAIVALAFVFWFFTKRHFMRVFIGVAGVLSCFVMLFYVWQGWAHVLLSLLAFTVTSVIYFVIAKKSKKSA